MFLPKRRGDAIPLVGGQVCECVVVCLPGQFIQCRERCPETVTMALRNTLRLYRNRDVLR